MAKTESFFIGDTGTAKVDWVHADPDNPVESIVWKSGDTFMLKVDSDGEDATFECLSAGECLLVVTATSKNGEQEEATLLMSIRAAADGVISIAKAETGVSRRKAKAAAEAKAAATPPPAPKKG